MVSGKQYDLSLDDPAKATYDIIVIGGGIYGVMLAYEASKLGKKVLVLEKDSFGIHTSSNSLRIIHGGLRYLQTLDLKRFFESVSERQWFLKTFPQHISPLRCLMPLYSKGLHRPLILKAALSMNDMLSCKRNNMLPSEQQIPNGKIISPEKVVQFFPGVDQAGLTGGAVWTDAFMPDSLSLIHEIIEKTKKNKGIFLEKVKAVYLLSENNRAIGVKAFDKKISRDISFSGKVIVNAAGPWCRHISKRFDRDIADLFHPSLAWNILFDRPALSRFAVAVTPGRKGSRAFFVLPFNGKIFAGTGHGIWNLSQRIKQPQPTQYQINAFISDLNSAIPGLALNETEIDTVFSGLLPAKKEKSHELKCREMIVDHREYHKNFFSISGVKFTTSRLVAQKTLEKIFSEKKRKS